MFDLIVHTIKRREKMDVLRKVVQVTKRTCSSSTEINFMDIIHRDQRTTKTHLREMHSITNCCNCSSKSTHAFSRDFVKRNQIDSKCDMSRIGLRQNNQHTSPRMVSKSPSRNRCSILQSVAELIVISVCIINTIRLPVALTASVNRRSMDKELGATSHWTNPCGVDGTDYGTYESLSESQLIQNIISEAKDALLQAMHFRDEFIHDNFGKSFATFHSEWINSSYDWIPLYPKTLGENVYSDDLKLLDFRETLLKAYTDLQTFAIGFEQVVSDAKENSPKFANYFNISNNHIRSVLCEIQTSIIELSLEKPEDVTRAVMSAELRNMKNKTFINVRDWIIYREYINALEYIIQAFEYFQKKFEGNLFMGP